jgi:two-component system sensor histidine kinase/response regulator
MALGVTTTTRRPAAPARRRNSGEKIKRAELDQMNPRVVMHDLTESRLATSAGGPNAGTEAVEPAGRPYAGTAPIEDAGPASAPRRRPNTIRTMLVWTAVAWMVPVWVVIALGIWTFYQREREHVAKSTISIAHALMAAVDRDMAATTGAAEVLAASTRLASGDFAGFQAKAEEVLPLLFGSNVVIIDPSGAQLVNTLRPYGEPLPLDGATPETGRVLETRKPIVSNVFLGAVTRKPILAIEVPVFRGNEVKYTLAIGLFTERLHDLLIHQGLPSDWIVSIFDASGTIAARTHDPERFVGKKGAPGLLSAMAQTRDGVLETSMVGDIPVFAAFSQSNTSNWAVAIGVPVAELYAGLYKSFLYGSSGALVFLSFGIFLAGYQSRRIARSVHALIGPAIALGRGEVPKIPQLQVREADDVAQAIDRASHLLQSTTVERDYAQLEKYAADIAAAKIARAYQQVEAANKELEEFAFAAAHDLKAPLRAIDTVSHWLEEDLQQHLTGENLKNMRVLRGRVARMEKLLDDLLEYSRIGHATDGRYEEMIEGDVLMENVMTLLSPPEGFTVKVSPDFARIRVNRMPLQQILMNLINNAIKHHDKKAGRIDVTVEDRGTVLAFAVQDDGPGIPARFQQQVFKMFQTLKPRDQVEGSGMGLAMVRKNVAVFGGTLDLESFEGNGSTFRFTWPKQQKLNGKNA